MEDIILAGHKINIDEEQIVKINPDNIKDEIKSYLEDLLKRISQKAAAKQYTIKRDTTEFARFLHDLNGGTEHNSLETDSANNIAKRLLEQEIESDSEMSKRLKRPEGYLKRGSFLQFLFTTNNTRQYLGVKLEHTSFIDEDDFKKKIGMPEIGAVFKACLATFNEDGTPKKEIKIFDTNGSTKYWWSSFLELEQVHDDEFNTEKAYKSVISLLDRYSGTSPRDVRALTNAVTTRFRQQNNIDFPAFVDELFGNYTPFDDAFKKKIPSIQGKIKELPGKNGFDTQFDIKPDTVKFKPRRFPINKVVTLEYKEGFDDINSLVWRSKIEGDVDVIMVKCEEMDVTMFPFKPAPSSHDENN